MGPAILIRDEEDDCKDTVLNLFPDICLSYLDELLIEHERQPNRVVEFILDKAETGEAYPKQPRQSIGKRKRSDEEIQEDEADHALKKFDHEGRREKAPRKTYVTLARSILAQEFPRVPVVAIKAKLSENGNLLLPSYLALDEAIAKWDDKNPPWRMKRYSTYAANPINLENAIDHEGAEIPTERMEMIEELQAARKVSKLREATRISQNEEAANLEQAKIDGTLQECGCCFDEFPINRMVRCSADNAHHFCKDCARRQVENLIGMSKHELACMSMDGCLATFTASQKALFLDNRLQTALDRIEQEAVLRAAGIENLETCPFCPFAAEYPAVEEDKEFRCLNPECRMVSCRMCRRETHIPQSCEEAATDRGLSLRRTIEEAMSAALIRKCNQCQNPFVKTDGCNKIRCTRCGTTQCYICKQTINDYSHFNDLNRGGKEGQCPLFDASGTETRHEEEVRRAEEDMRDKVTKDNPEVDNETLKIKVSERVKQDDVLRKQRNIGRHGVRDHMADMMRARHEILANRLQAGRDRQRENWARQIMEDELLPAMVLGIEEPAWQPLDQHLGQAPFGAPQAHIQQHQDAIRGAERIAQPNYPRAHHGPAGHQDLGPQAAQDRIIPVGIPGRDHGLVVLRTNQAPVNPLCHLAGHPPAPSGNDRYPPAQRSPRLAQAAAGPVPERDNPHARLAEVRDRLATRRREAIARAKRRELHGLAIMQHLKASIDRHELEHIPNANRIEQENSSPTIAPLNLEEQADHKDFEMLNRFAGNEHILHDPEILRLGNPFMGGGVAAIHQHNQGCQTKGKGIDDGDAATGAAAQVDRLLRNHDRVPSAPRAIVLHGALKKPPADLPQREGVVGIPRHSRCVVVQGPGLNDNATAVRNHVSARFDNGFLAPRVTAGHIPKVANWGVPIPNWPLFAPLPPVGPAQGPAVLQAAQAHQEPPRANQGASVHQLPGAAGQGIG